MVVLTRYILLIFAFFILTVYADESIDSLLNQYAQEDDLSKQTKKESAGYLQIFTRADLDRMQIKSLYELIEKIAFVRYNENSAGLSDINYSPYQTNTFSHMKLYLNDRELIAPFSGNGFQLLGQIDIGYIDHIEVYTGIPSFEIGLETAITIIKMYTKKGSRENSTVFGSSLATRGTTDTHIYKSESFDGLSYLFYADNRNLNREPVYNNGYKLSKDKNTNNIYAEIEKGNYRFEFQYTDGYMDNFMGQSWDITPSENDTDFWYLYGGLYYTSDDKSYKFSINYNINYSKNIQQSDGHLGIVQTDVYPYIYIYDDMVSELREELSDLELKKVFESKNNKLLVGFRTRYKKFVFETLKLGDYEVPENSYNREVITSAYVDNSYTINAKSIFTASMKYDRYFENGGIKDSNILGGRLGYIYHSNKMTLKSFLFYGEVNPNPFVLYYQSQLTDNEIKEQKVLSLSSKAIFRQDKNKFSLLLGRSYYYNGIYFTDTEYKNLDDTLYYDTISFRDEY